MSTSTNTPDPIEITKRKVLYILQTQKTHAVGEDPNEIYAAMIANHIHRYFVLKDEAV